MKIICYHYIRKYNLEFPYFKFLNIEDFKKQIDYFLTKYELISKEIFIKILKKEIKPKDNYLVLSFDDGLIDHYEYVLPELKRRNLWGIFFIPKVDKLLTVHGVHLLLGRYKACDLLKYCKNIISDQMIVQDRLEIFKGIYSNFENNDNNDIIFKKIINYFLDEKYKSEIIRKLFLHFFPNCNFKNYYLNYEQIKLLQENGNIIGLHSSNHDVMSNLIKSEQEEDIKNNYQYLKEFIQNEELKLFAYPYGNSESFNQDTMDILKKYNISHAFTFIHGDIIDLDSKYEVPRLDCNLFPNGKIFNYSKVDKKNILKDYEFKLENIDLYDKITLFTSNQKRHFGLINKLSKICKKLFVIIEIRKEKIYHEQELKEYFNYVNNSENKFFYKYNKIIPNNCITKYIKFNELSDIKLSELKDFLNSDNYIVYGSSFIKNDLCNFLVNNNCINIHIGLSPYYRGCATTFWPVFEKNYELVGATIHKLSKGLDSGDIIIHCVPNKNKCNNIFDFTMKVVDIAQNALVINLKNKNIWRYKWVKQDKNQEIKYCRYKEFTTEVAGLFLNKLPNINYINLDSNKCNYVNPYFD